MVDEQMSAHILTINCHLNMHFEGHLEINMNKYETMIQFKYHKHKGQYVMKYAQKNNSQK